MARMLLPEINIKTVLGIDISTQSLSAVLLRCSSGEILWDHSLSYRNDSRLSGFGFEHDTMIIPPREPGEAEQPPRLFIAALDALFCDLKNAGVDIRTIAAINTSGQQHGHVYLNDRARASFASLRDPGSARKDLAAAISGSFSYGGAPIWKTSNTAVEAARIRAAAGGKTAIIERIGSDIPLRFSAAVHRRLAIRYPETYAATRHLMQISSLIPAILTGDCTIPIDFGNACGTGLMNYAARMWDDVVLNAVADDLHDGTAGLAAKLPSIAHPLSICGTVASYFQIKYGLSADCMIIVGSGDNPQTKVLASGDLLSLGTSFVYMISSPDGRVDATGAANAMYDGLGRPFNFCCRTNGALTWDQLRPHHGLGAADYAACDSALTSVAPGSLMRFWHPDAESFPVINSHPEPVRLDNAAIDFDSDFSAIVDSSLGLLYQYGMKISGASDHSRQPAMSVCGGPSVSPTIMDRIAAIWNRSVIQTGQAGAALGAAAAAAVALFPEHEREAVAERLRAAISSGKAIFMPDPEMVRAYHAPGGYLERMESCFERIRSAST